MSDIRAPPCRLGHGGGQGGVHLAGPVALEPQGGYSASAARNDGHRSALPREVAVMRAASSLGLGTRQSRIVFEDAGLLLEELLEALGLPGDGGLRLDSPQRNVAGHDVAQVLGGQAGRELGGHAR